MKKQVFEKMVKVRVEAEDYGELVYIKGDDRIISKEFYDTMVKKHGPKWLLDDSVEIPNTEDFVVPTKDYLKWYKEDAFYEYGKKNHLIPSLH
jgi:hypothetical protein